MAKERKQEAQVSGIARRRKAARKDSSKGYRERKQSLLIAAAAIFQEKGFQAVRMEDVASLLNVDRATLYYYFGNKQQLFREVIIDAVKANVEEARKIERSEEPAPVKLRTLLGSLLESYDRLYPLLFVYVQEDMSRIVTDSSPESKELVRLGAAYERMVKQIIDQGIEEGDFAAETRSTVAAYAIIGAANWSHRWFRPNGKLSGSEVGEFFADLFLDGLLVGPARNRRRRTKRAAAAAG